MPNFHIEMLKWNILKAVDWLLQIATDIKCKIMELNLLWVFKNKNEPLLRLDFATIFYFLYNNIHESFVFQNIKKNNI